MYCTVPHPDASFTVNDPNFANRATLLETFLFFFFFWPQKHVRMIYRELAYKPLVNQK